MKSGKDDIKNIFSSRLNGFETELPASLWEKIEADLPASQTSAIAAPKRYKIYKYMAWMAGAAAVVLALFIFNPKDYDNSNDGLATQTNTSINKYNLNNEVEISKTQEHDVDNKVINQKSNNILAAHSRLNNTKRLPQEVLSSAVVLDTLNVLNNVAEDNIEDIYTSQEIKESEAEFDSKNDDEFEKDLAKKIAEFELDSQNGERLLAYNILEEADNKQSSNSFEIGLEGSSGFSKSTEVQNQLRHSVIYATSGDGITSAYIRQTIKLQHSQPISFGIAINKKISNRVSLESGLVYTYLYSKAKSINGSNHKLRDSQSLHYIGLPLSVNYRLAEWNKIQLYLSAGGMVQKDFYGILNTTQSVPELEDTRELIRNNISQDHPQYSLTGSLGLSYPIYNRLYIYTNFGGAYYFDSHNKYETIYSDRKWLFNLNLGLKFGL